MSIERIMSAMAGFFVFASVGLGYYHHEYWFFFTAFVGLNLFQSAFTGFCLPAILLKALGFKNESELAAQTKEA